MQIIDTHAHIDQLEDLGGALQRAHGAGVTDIVAVSVDLTSMRKILDIAQNHSQPKIHPALGIHPGTIKPEEQLQAFDFIRAHIAQAIAVGETGLDYWYKWVRKDMAERKKQQDSFEMHLQMAREFNLPIIIHSRGAERDCLAMTQSAGVSKALFHWYSGSVDILEQILNAGYYVSTSPSVAYSEPSRQAMARAPLDRILIETDAPVRYSDFLAEPKDVVRTLKALADLKNTDEQTVLTQVNQNARDFFTV